MNSFTKFLSVLSFLCFISLHGYVLNAQTTEKLTLNLANTSVEEVLNQIESQSKYRFLYNKRLIDVNRKTTVRFTNQEISSILKELFKNTDVVYSIEGNQIVLSNKLDKTQEAPIHKRIKISGIIVDEKGETLVGATIKAKGAAIGTITDLNGLFTLEVDENAVLIVSTIGYQTQEVKVNGKTNFRIVMSEDDVLLEEVIVVGYGTMKKTDLTGAVSSIKTDNLTITSDASIGQLIKGKAAGVTALSTSAQPGGAVNIIIRGEASGASNEPLYVIDGFPISNESPEPGNGTQYSQGSRSHLNSLNPSDIESIEILKDASATAIYGARAANGVVLITTKRGKHGLKLNYSGSFTAQSIDKPFEVYDAKNYMIQTNSILRERWLRDKKIFPYGNTDPSTVASFSGARFTQEQIDHAGGGTNWWDQIMRTGQVHNHNVSLTYGSDKMRSYASLGYYNNKGVVEGSGIERISTKINLDYTINKFIQAGISYMGARIDNDNVQMGEGEWGDSNMIMSALLYDPSVPVRDEDGNYSEMSWYANLPNPVSYRDVDDKTKQTRNLINFYLQLEPIKNLQIKTSAGYDGQSSVRKTYFPKTFLLGKNKDGQAAIGQANQEDFLFNTVVTYNFELQKKHKFTIMGGYEYQKFERDGNSLGAVDFFTDAFLYNNISIGNQEKYTIGSYKEREVLASYFGRINYNLLDRYLLTLNFRYDGSDKFGLNNKWAFFPSASVGWRLSEEPFMKGFKELSNLKIRLSYGQTGNSRIGRNAFAFYGVAANRWAFNSSPVPGVELDQLENNDLKWETTTEMNIGLDFGFFDNRISGAFEYFNKTISDLLGGQNLRSWGVVSTVAANLGKTQSKGVELTLNTVNIKTRDFQWTTDFTYTRYRDRWKERSPDVVLNPWQKVDDPLRAVHYWQYDGIVQIGETVPHMPNAVPGNAKIKDINGFDENMNYTGEPDGKIDEADIVYRGTSDPDFTIGFNNTFKYKDFDLNIYAYGSFNKLAFNGMKLKYIGYSAHMAEDGTNLWVEASKRWSSDNPNGIYPSDASNSYMGSEAWTLEKASFLRINNITLGYTMPKKLLPKEIGGVRIYVDFQNPFLFTKWEGMDPEIAGSNKAPYPNQRSYSIGVNLQF